jgi:uncharacterized protein
MTMIPEIWLYGLLGGLMIGGAAALYLLVNGRIMGASGILGGLVDGSGRDTWRERLFFLAGLAGAPALVVLWRGAPDTHLTSNVALLIVAGLLTGIGTRLANGCTSGHGVVGLARFSPRSIAAVLSFLSAGVLVLFVARHLLGVI